MGRMSQCETDTFWRKIRRYRILQNKELFERFGHGVFVRRYSSVGTSFSLGFRLLYCNFVKMHVNQTIVYATLPLFTIGLSEYAENVNNSDFEKVFFFLHCFDCTFYHLAKCYRFLWGHFFRKSKEKENIVRLYPI